MKRFVIIPIFIFILAGLLVSPSMASPSYQTTPTVTVTASPTPEPVMWKVYPDSYPDDYDNLTMENPLDVALIGNDGYGEGGGEGAAISAGIVCNGAACAKRDIYYSIDIGATWVTQDSNNYLGARELWLMIQYSPSEEIIIKLPCGSGTGDVCSQEQINGVIPAEDIYWEDGDERQLDIRADVTGGAFNLEKGDVSYTSLHVILSTEPIDCEEFYIQDDDVASGNIDPTVENPNAISLVQGNKYRLELSGGPWNSSRYDAAFSLDNATWKVISANPVDVTTLSSLEDIDCSTKYEDGRFVMYFTAPSTTFKIRVNDTPGAFANNTGSLTYRLTNVREAGGECQSQYSYDPDANLLASGTLILDDQDGQLLAARNDGYSSSGFTALSQALGLTPAEIVPNGHYLLVLTGAWQDSNGGLNKSTYQAKKSLGQWQGFGSSDQENCIFTSTNRVEYYWQADGDTSLLVRPNSTDSNWTNNTGNVQWAVYGVTFNQRPNICSSTFTLGQQLGSGTIDAAKEGGVMLPSYGSMAVPATGGAGEPSSDGPQAGWTNRYIAIETEGGPWRDNGQISYDVAFSIDGGYDWGRLDLYAECVVMLDKYHYRAYIPASEIWENIPDALDNTIVNNMIKVRAWDQDNNFLNNSRTINFRWYYATKQVISDETLAAGTCSSNFSHTVSATSTIPVNAKSSSGVYLPDMPITSQVSIYALETTGAWSHEGVTDRYDIEISDDGGVEWWDIHTYDGTQCAQYISDQDHHILAYFMPITGKRYKVRVNDETNTWSANPTGTLSVKVYSATGSYNAWTHCGSQYSLVPVGVSSPSENTTMLQRALWDLADWLGMNLAKLEPLSATFPSISANLPQGVLVGYDFYTGINYAVSTYAGAWGTECVGVCALTNKTIDVSLDNGSSWNALSTMTGQTCVVDLESGYRRVYFVAPANTKMRLRVSGTNYPNQIGEVEYIIFAVADETGTPLYTAQTVPQWAASCTTQCTAPQLFNTMTVAGVDVGVPNADVGAWISYAGCRIEYFFSWCPEHTAMLMGLFSYFKKYEPFGTFYEVISLIDSARGEAEAYTFVDECSPDAAVSEGGGDPSDSFMPILNDASPWNGGQAFTEQSTGGFGDPNAVGGFNISAETTACWSGMENYMGQASTGFLMFIEFTKRAFGGVFYFYIGIFFQVVVIGFGLAYFQKRWQVIAW